MSEAPTCFSSQLLQLPQALRVVVAILTRIPHLTDSLAFQCSSALCTHWHSSEEFRTNLISYWSCLKSVKVDVLGLIFSTPCIRWHSFGFVLSV